MPKTQHSKTSQRLQSARATLASEIDGLKQLDQALDGDFGKAFELAVDIILNAPGRVILSGIGKSGHVARKIAATMASTGTPASFVHAAEASHGDLGMVTDNDVIIVLSNSGETHELKDILGYAKRTGVPLIAITANRRSTLANAANVTLAMPKTAEACPRGLAPTTSTTMQLAIGDCLAIALLEETGFSSSDFHRFHPGGKLGAALVQVSDIMHKGEKLPLVDRDTAMAEVLIVMSQKSFGCAGVCDENGLLCGIITDGDLRRHMGAGLLEKKADEIMTAAPKTVPGELAALAALELLTSKGITSLFVVDDGRPAGLVHIHDLLHIGIGRGRSKTGA